MKEDRQFVTALARGLEVLRCFSPARQVLSATEIAARIGLPQPTVWRLCHTLVATGYLVAAPGGKLRIGAPVLALGYAAVASLDYLQVIRPHMQQLADRFGATVSLAERHRSKMIYIACCQGEALVTMNLKVGARLSLHDTAVGWAWLAALPADRRAQVLERLKRAFGNEWAPHQANIDRAVEQYEAKGYVTNHGVAHTGIRSAAVPVLSPDGKPALSMNCAAPSAVLSETVLVADVAPALVEIGHMLETQMALSAAPRRRRPAGAPAR